jgi:hypothetical protein
MLLVCLESIKSSATKLAMRSAILSQAVEDHLCTIETVMNAARAFQNRIIAQENELSEQAAAMVVNVADINHQARANANL